MGLVCGEPAHWLAIGPGFFSWVSKANGGCNE